MAIKFPKRRCEEGEIIHPDDLNQNIIEFSNEINGNLDSDNLSSLDDYTFDVFQENTFNQVFVSSSFAGELRVPHETTAYVKKCGVINTEGDKDGPATYADGQKDIGFIEIDAESDGWIIVDFQATVEWRGTGIRDLDELFHKHAKNCYFIPSGSSEIADTGFAHPNLPVGGWAGISGSRGSTLGPYAFDDELTVSSSITSLASESRTMIYNSEHQNYPQGWWVNHPVDYYAVQFRVTLNGVLVCETGYISNGNNNYGFSITGSVPIVAGKNRVDVEVRGMDMRDTKTSRVGIGAIDESGYRGQLYPVQTTVGADDKTALPEFRSGYWDSTDLSDNPLDYGESDLNFVSTKPAGAGPTTGFSGIDKGICCNIADRLLMVQYRKR